MAKKPTYEELEQRVKELEKESVMREQAEEALKETYIRYRLLLEASEACISLLDEYGNFLIVNTPGAKTWATTVEDMEGKNLKDIMPPNMANEAIGMIRKVKETGTIIDKNNNDESFLKVFVPTPPNPASGTVAVVKESQTRDPGWSIEEALKSVISAGVIGPTEIK